MRQPILMNQLKFFLLSLQKKHQKWLRSFKPKTRFCLSLFGVRRFVVLRPSTDIKRDVEFYTAKND
jgi:hypothetical protein